LDGVVLNNYPYIIYLLKDSCTCKGKDIVLRPFKVSKSRTLLVCITCDGLVAEWLDKVYPPDKEFKDADNLI
jgi:hypothetical protein